MSPAASADVVIAVMGSEMADALRAACTAAADLAHERGLPEDACVEMYNTAMSAAALSLDNKALSESSTTSTAGTQAGRSQSTPAKRPPASADKSLSRFGTGLIEASLARAIKKHAVRVLDLFREWDVDNNGEISKAEFRSALSGSGISASAETMDELFDEWDADHSGAIDYTELNRALKKGMAKLREEGDSVDGGEALAEEIKLLGGDRRAAVKQAKEWKEAAREYRTRLSPRSQQLKEEREAEQQQKEELQLQMWKEDEESGRRWTAAKWLQSRKIAHMIAGALELPPLTADATSQFAYVKKLKREQLVALLEKANLSGLSDFIWESVASLSHQSTGSAEILNEKFGTTAKFQMTYGSLSLFYGGLESLLGPPKMYKGAQHEEKSLFNSMEFEHCNEKDSKATFTAPNGVTTDSSTEWDIVCSPEAGRDYPERQGYRAHHPAWCRVPQKLAVMLQAMEDKCNARLRPQGHSEMIVEELVGGRLYTGPMYVKYNTVLRSKTNDRVVVQLAKDLTKGNGYATTIHAINSCVIKLSKLTKAGKVWRGIKDATLPKEFWVPNEMGVRGGIEYGFSSTTTDREQALLYAGGLEQKDASTIFEMQMGMVDRGADLTWLSQYPHESEVLLPPLTGIEALTVDVDGSMLVIHSRLSLNLASHTLEQVLSRRRKMLMDMVSGIELEMRDALGDSLVEFGIALLKRALAYGPLTKDPEWFNDDENFAQVMQQTLQLQHGVVTQINRLHAATTELNLRSWKLTGSARILLLAGWCYQRAATTDKTVHETMAIDLRDANLNTSEAVQLAELMRKQSRLTSVDVRNNEGIGTEGAEALAKFIESNVGIGVTARSVCGVTPSNSTLEVPRTLGTIAARLLAAEMRTFVFAEGVSASMGDARGKGKVSILNRRGAFAANDWQPLLWAAKEGHAEMLTTLLDLGLDINEQQVYAHD